MDDILFLCPMCENENTDDADGGFPCHCVGVSENPGFVSYSIILFEALFVRKETEEQAKAELKRRAQVPLTDDLVSEMIAIYRRKENEPLPDRIVTETEYQEDDDIPF